jgi:hypothetical protein
VQQAKCSSQNAPCRPQPTAIAVTGSAETFSDRAATSYGSEGWGSNLPERARSQAPPQSGPDKLPVERTFYGGGAPAASTVVRVRLLTSSATTLSGRRAPGLSGAVAISPATRSV